MVILLLGPPGAGKGTQAMRIARKLEIPHISTGDMLRAAMREGTPTGLEAKSYVERGALVPDEIVLRLVQERLAQNDCQKGALLDGFPRTVQQAEALSAFSPVDVVINLDVADEELIERLSGRRYCPKCSATAHVSTLTDNRCPQCGETMIQRKDDEAQTVKSRLDVYQEQTRPLVDYYTNKGLLRAIDGAKDMEDVFADVMAALEENA